MDVAAWLKDLGLEQYAKAFAENEVDATLLSELTNEDLKDLGVARLADRKKILKAIATITEWAGAEPSVKSKLPTKKGQLRIFCYLIFTYPFSFYCYHIFFLHILFVFPEGLRLLSQSNVAQLLNGYIYDGAIPCATCCIADNWSAVV